MTATESSTGIASLSGIVLDCPDPIALAQFYSDLSGWPIHESSDEGWAVVVTPWNVALAFQRVADYVAPNWPGTEPPQQFHLDFDVADLDEGEAKVVALGATRAATQPGESFRVFLDPAGHPFCLCVG
jgi:predicted enzyme related to lactoylglutathione lyase